MAQGPRHPRRAAHRGFTLVELVMVLVLLGVLAVFAAPRIFSQSDFEARGFHDETLALLRYAQKNAVAQRRGVCVSFTANTVSLGLLPAPERTDCDNAGPLRGPGGLDSGATTARVSARSSVVFNPTPPNFQFDGLGRPLDWAGQPLATLTVQVAGAQPTITVEATTGYVHD